VNSLFVRECVQCGANMIAPTRAEYLSDLCVRNVWSCEACGHQFEDLVYLFVRHKVEIEA
jgi:ribosomal protein L37AE/L43A